MNTSSILVKFKNIIPSALNEKVIWIEESFDSYLLGFVKKKLKFWTWNWREEYKWKFKKS